MQRKINNLIAAGLLLCGLIFLAGWMMQSGNEMLVDIPVVTSR